MRLIAVSIVLAGAMIGGAIMWHGRYRIVSIQGGVPGLSLYIVHDQWSGTAKVCATYGAPLLKRAGHGCFGPGELPTALTDGQP